MSFHFEFVVFGTNSVCACALNLVVFLLFGKTSEYEWDYECCGCGQGLAADCFSGLCSKLYRRISFDPLRIIEEPPFRFEVLIHGVLVIGSL